MFFYFCLNVCPIILATTATIHSTAKIKYFIFFIFRLITGLILITFYYLLLFVLLLAHVCINKIWRPTKWCNIAQPNIEVENCKIRIIDHQFISFYVKPVLSKYNLCIYFFILFFYLFILNRLHLESQWFQRNIKAGNHKHKVAKESFGRNQI